MIKLSYDEAVAKIKELSTLSEEEIHSNVNAKLEQFSGLVSKEGAAHILANELGIKLIDTTSAKLKVANILAGMQNVEVLTKVLAAYPARQFNSKGRTGQVGSAILGDETGTIRSVFWNEQANKLAFMNKGDILKLKGVYVKENRNKVLELHFNNRSTMVLNPPGETVEVKERVIARKRLNEITDNDTLVEVLGTVIEVFDLRFYEICEKCGKRARPEEGNFICAEHGSVTPKYAYVLNVFLDDGTAAVRTVFFRNMAQQFLKKSDDELLAFKDAPEGFEQVKNESLGNFIRVSARVNKNEMFNRIELIANNVSEAKPEEAKAEAAAAPTEAPTSPSNESGETTTDPLKSTTTATTEQTIPNIETKQLTETETPSNPSVK